MRVFRICPIKYGPTGPTGLTGITGATGATGPTGPAALSASCDCVNQMRHILEQIIEYYPNDTVIVSLESGNNASGRPGYLLPAPNSNPNSGLLILTNSQGMEQEAIPLCHIASIRVTSSVYNDNINYLPAPSPIPGGCDAQCEEALYDYLPVGTDDVRIVAGGQTVGRGTVIRDEYGMVVLVGPNCSDPTFVSLCKTEIVTK